MRETFVTHSQAVKLKEFGFNWEAFGKYIDCPNDPTLFSGMIYQPWNLEPDEIIAPTLAQAAKWLRDEMGIHVSVNPYTDSMDAEDMVCDNRCFWSFELMEDPHGFSLNKNGGEFDSYESALSAGISTALELLGKEAADE